MNKALKWTFVAACLAGATWAGMKIFLVEYPEVSRLRAECAREQAAVDDLKVARNNLSREILELDEDPRTIEKYARKEGWVREGETMATVALSPALVGDGARTVVVDTLERTVDGDSAALAGSVLSVRVPAYGIVGVRVK